MTADILRQIDRLTDLCPCGATPRPRSAYCGYDCEPGWLGEDATDLDDAGMHWRPDNNRPEAQPMQIGDRLARAAAQAAPALEGVASAFTAAAPVFTRMSRQLQQMSQDRK